jgi:hypothetical protein
MGHERASHHTTDERPSSLVRWYGENESKCGYCNGRRPGHTKSSGAYLVAAKLASPCKLHSEKSFVDFVYDPSVSRKDSRRAIPSVNSKHVNMSFNI